MTETFFTRTIQPLLNLTEHLHLIEYLRQKCVFVYEVHCLGCSTSMFQVKKTSAVDKYAFRCAQKGCIKYQSYASIRTGSFLNEFSISLKKFINFIYLFSRETLQKEIMEQVGISESTVHKLVVKLRTKIEHYLLNNPIVLGGPQVICQIDESKFNFNVKAHKGHAPLVPILVFGIVDTSFRPA
jgi:predicted DNA-binding protein (UPF0251 family)